MTKIIAIAGPTCSGKTKLAYALYEKLREHALYYALERDYKSLSYTELRDASLVNFDTDTAFDLDMTKRTLDAIKRGKKEIFLNTYDYHTKVRGTKERIVIGGSKQYRRPTGPTIYMDEVRYVIIEGMFALHSKIAPLVDVGVFLDLPLEECYDERLRKDYESFGRTPEEVNVRWNKHILVGYRDQVLPTKERAHLVFHSSAEVATFGLAKIFEKLGANPGISYEW